MGLAATIGVVLTVLVVVAGVGVGGYIALCTLAEGYKH